MLWGSLTCSTAAAVAQFHLIRLFMKGATRMQFPAETVRHQGNKGSTHRVTSSSHQSRQQTCGSVTVLYRAYGWLVPLLCLSQCLDLQCCPFTLFTPAACIYLLPRAWHERQRRKIGRSGA